MTCIIRFCDTRRKARFKKGQTMIALLILLPVLLSTGYAVAELMRVYRYHYYLNYAAFCASRALLVYRDTDGFDDGPWKSLLNNGTGRIPYYEFAAAFAFRPALGSRGENPEEEIKSELSDMFGDILKSALEKGAEGLVEILPEAGDMPSLTLDLAWGTVKDYIDKKMEDETVQRKISAVTDPLAEKMNSMAGGGAFFLAGLRETYENMVFEKEEIGGNEVRITIKYPYVPKYLRFGGSEIKLWIKTSFVYSRA